VEEQAQEEAEKALDAAEEKKLVITRCGGKIPFKSEAEKGLVFTVAIP